ncbi:DUF86 domain-containing protein [Haladaptatus pallidirubidus]|uniref:DUF86 domain-containing protein n=1 Tax=Haladaptatus pallidirubidus TaxID=1008152 RepID=A0AAV3UND3_9EURY|nr:DUF86 domain-containing protein [Haladaptatus pallidirubidus]
MDERTESRILEKAQYISEALAVLVQKRESLSFADYRAQREQRDIVEREFETTIEACIDIGKMILKADGETIPPTNVQVFHELERQEILDTKTARKMAQAAGFRNILSHQYGNDINDEDVYNFLHQNLPLFHEYLGQVRDFLD